MDFEPIIYNASSMQIVIEIQLFYSGIIIVASNNAQSLVFYHLFVIQKILSDEIPHCVSMDHVWSN